MANPAEPADRDTVEAESDHSTVAQGLRGPEPKPARRARLHPGILTAAALIVLAILAFALARTRVALDGRAVLQEFRSVSAVKLLLGLATIYGCYWLRAVRWAVLLGPSRQAGASKLFPTQLIGFSAVALFGRVADLGRPYLTARQLGSPVAPQLGVYSVERTLDLAAAALVFSATLALAPAHTPHHAAYARAGTLSLLATLGFGLVVLTLALAGDRLARWSAGRLHRFSPRGSHLLETRLLEFQAGLRRGATVRDLLLATLLSVLMWLGIALTYLLTAHAFVACPPLAGLSLPQTVLLMAAGIGGSLLQLPIVGWFTQTALLAATLHELFAVPLGSATAAGALIFFVGNLSVIPGGLLAAKLTGVRLRDSRGAQREEAVAPVEPGTTSARMGQP